MIWLIIAFISLAAIIWFLWLIWRIGHRGPRVDFRIEHREPGYLAHLDDTPIPAPNYPFIVRVLGIGAMLFVALGAVAGYQTARLSVAQNAESTEEALPTYVVLYEMTAEPLAESTEQLVAEITAETTAEPTALPFIIATDERLTLTPSLMPTYTDYPTLTPHIVIVTAIVTEIVERYDRVVITSPPQVVYITSPPIYIQPTNPAPVVIPTLGNTATPTLPTVTPSATATVGVCIPSPTPGMFQSPTPPGYMPTACYTPTLPFVVETDLPAVTATSTPTATPTETSTLIPAPSETPTLTSTPTATLAESTEEA